MTVWIHASKLEEANGQPEKCEPIISRGVAKIAKKKQVFEREPWIDSAQDCDKVSSPETSKAIIKAIYMLDAQEHDGVSIWLDDISLAIQRGNAISARTMLEQAVTLAPNDKRLWEAYLEFEQRAGEGKYPKILERAAQISGLSGHAFLLRLGRELVRTGQVDKAKALLSEALKSSPKEESIWLANLEMLKQSGQQEECRKAIREAIATLPESTGLWRYSIKFERDMAHLPLALAEAEKAVAKFPLDIGIACDYGVILEELNRFDKARENYLSLTKTPKCQKDSRPWIHWMKLEEKLSGPAKVSYLLHRLELSTRVQKGMFMQIPRCGSALSESRRRQET
jgi:Flp pilus assembly protein TadD